jgi:hypothetical protein
LRDDVVGPRKRVEMGSSVPQVPTGAGEDRTLQATHDEVAAAIAAAAESVAGAHPAASAPQPEVAPEPGTANGAAGEDRGQQGRPPEAPAQ